MWKHRTIYGHNIDNLPNILKEEEANGLVLKNVLEVGAIYVLVFCPSYNYNPPAVNFPQVTIPTVWPNPNNPNQPFFPFYGNWNIKSDGTCEKIN